MADLRESTEAELEFIELHAEIRNLGLYDLLSKITAVFYKNSQERYEAGLKEGERIFKQ
tara:strand:- start:1339 stop:1515 length:177 start_codon:yes stop_codon:yes gene_type:complete